MEEEPLKTMSHVPSDRIMGEKGTVMGEGSTDQPAGRPVEAHNARDVDADMDLGQGTPNPASDEQPGSDPVPSGKEPEPKSAFVKVMELKEKEMLTAYLEAFFGKFYDF